MASPAATIPIAIRMSSSVMFAAQLEQQAGPGCGWLPFALVLPGAYWRW